jgi:hypothetical protein
MNISLEARTIIGWILITVPTIEFGGAFLLSRLRSKESTVPNSLRQSYYRAGHAHAGVLVIFSIIGQLLVDVSGFTAPLSYAVRAGFFLAPILVSGGFFLGAPTTSTKPGVLINLVYVGAVVLAVTVFVLGIGLVFTPNA